MGGNLLVETDIQARTLVGLDDMPHLGLAVLPVTFLREGIVRVHLHGKVVLCIDELDEQRESESVFLVIFLANKVGEVDFEQFVKVVLSQESVGNDRLIVHETGDFPTLAAVFQRADVMFKDGFDFAAAPDLLFQGGCEFQRIEC